MLANFEALFLEPSIKHKPLTISEKPNFQKNKKKFRIFVHCEVYNAAYVRQCTLFLAQGILSKWLYSVDNLKIPLHNKKGSKSKKRGF